jgi:hypothetical protein
MPSALWICGTLPRQSRKTSLASNLSELRNWPSSMRRRLLSSAGEGD